MWACVKVADLVWARCYSWWEFTLQSVCFIQIIDQGRAWCLIRTVASNELCALMTALSHLQFLMQPAILSVVIEPVTGILISDLRTDNEISRWCQL